MSEFFDMGGYAFYVWTSYGLSALLLLINWLIAKKSETSTRAALQRKQASSPQ